MLRIGYVFFWVAIFIIPVLLVLFLPNSIKQLIYRSFYRILCRIFKIKVTVKGDLPKARPVLFCSNHVSYLDIITLGASLPSSFISKAEVGSWPLIGLLAKLTGTILIQRKKTQAGSHLASIKDAIKKKRNLTLFPEGTTGDGVNLLPFKSSLFKIAEDHGILVQPISIKYTKINGLPIHRNEVNEIAWVGDLDLAPHLKNLMSLGKIEVEVTILKPLAKSDDRKEITRNAEKAVADSLAT